MSVEHRGHWPEGLAPRMRIERRATMNGGDDRAICGVEMPLTRLSCTRCKGHSGDHVAGGVASIYARWANG